MSDRLKYRLPYAWAKLDRRERYRAIALCECIAFADGSQAELRPSGVWVPNGFNFTTEAGAFCASDFTARCKAAELWCDWLGKVGKTKQN